MNYKEALSVGFKGLEYTAIGDITDIAPDIVTYICKPLRVGDKIKGKIVLYFEGEELDKAAHETIEGNLRVTYYDLKDGRTLKVEEFI